MAEGTVAPPAQSQAPPQSSTTAAPPTSTQSGSGRGVQLKQRLAGDGFAAQSAALAPPGPFALGGGAAVQAKGDVGGDGVHAAAAKGTAGAGGALPHGDRIQAAFGSHDVSQVQAHVGGAAKEASQAMGAQAYASGNSVAFADSPTLHTAAHEAAHVVQQRAGVSLSGGVGKAGDGYEQHADKVADAVVSGRSAEGLLSQMAGGGGAPVQRKAVQALAGDLSTPAADQHLPTEMQGQGKTVGEAAQELHPGARDASFNPARKVEFEARLAELILGNPGAYMGTVAKVSQNVVAYIDAEAQAGLAGSKAEMVNLIMEGPQYFGRFVDEVLPGEEEKVADTLRQTLLSGGGGVSQHLMAHAKFNWEIYGHNWGDKVRRTFMQKFIAKNKFTATPPEGEGSLRDKAHVDTGKTDATNLFEGANRGRIKPNQPGSSRSGAVPITTSGAAGVRSGQSGETPAALSTAGMRPADQQALSGSHERGTDRWTVDEVATFCQQARIELNMPLSGGGPSGTTSDLLTVALAMGASSPQERLEYALACQGVLGAAGAHTFHEIMTVAQTIGVPYTPGSYAGVYPASFAGQVAALKGQFADLFPDGQNIATGGSGGGNGG